MDRSCRSIALLLAGLAGAALVFVILLFLLAGDQLTDFARETVLRITLVSRQNDLRIPIGSDPTPIRFTVDPGDTARFIGQRLEDQVLITDAELFADYVQLEDLDGELEAGTYFLNTTMNIKEIAAALTDSSLSQIVFTIIPGQRIEEVAASIDNNLFFAFSGQDFLNVTGRGADINPTFADKMGLPFGASVEGFLLPDTYSLPPETTPLMLRNILLDSFEVAASELSIVRAAEQGLSMYEVVTLASIVERETIHNDEMPLVAGVYRNRIDSGWRLEADPTVQYPLGTTGNWWPQITRANYQDVISDYNTYRVDGLPPGPIANPSLSAIEAVINPEPSDFFFFRADCRTDGYHEFARTFEEHVANGC
jgi:UPF0755 protein